VQNQRVRRRTTFECIYLAQRLRVARIGTEAVNGFGREGHEITRTQGGDGGRNVGRESAS
jgi:hypothetical protein